VSRPTKIDGLYDPCSQIETVEQVVNRYRPLIRLAVKRFLAEQQPQEPEVVENKQETVVNSKEGVADSGQQEAPQDGDNAR
jgi:hypothetical protein